MFLRRECAEFCICIYLQAMLVPGNSDLVLSESCPIVKSYNYSTLFLRIWASTDELQAVLRHVCGMNVSLAVICQTLKKMGLTRQRLKSIVVRRSDKERAKFMVQVQCIPANCFVWVDETESDHGDSRRKTGYGLRGIPPVSFQLRVRSSRISAVSCITTDGVEDLYLTEGSVNGDAFMEFVHQSLLPVLKTFNGQNTKSIVLLYNASIHHVEKVQEAVNGVGALLWFLPLYSPDLNLIEECFSKVKKFLTCNSVAFQSTDSPRVLVTAAFATVTKEDCLGYIQHAGYGQ